MPNCSPIPIISIDPTHRLLAPGSAIQDQRSKSVFLGLSEANSDPPFSPDDAQPVAARVEFLMSQIVSYPSFLKTREGGFLQTNDVLVNSALRRRLTPADAKRLDRITGGMGAERLRKLKARLSARRIASVGGARQVRLAAARNILE